MPINLKSIFDLAIQKNASDIHFQQGQAPVLRMNGQLVQVSNTEPFQFTAESPEILSYLSQDHQKIYKEHGNVDFAFDHAGQRFRANLYRQRTGISLSLRLIRSHILSFEQLGLPLSFKKMATDYRQGFFLIVGPTGQGKSTTLATIINEINTTRESHIITIEDPIEYLFKNNRSIIEQREVGMHTSSFSHALRAAMRQDPDIILIGEMRDFETMQAAVTLAETGHLVFSTMHTNDVVQTIDRIIDIFPEERQKQVRLQLASTLSGVVSQRLIPGVDGRQVMAYEQLMVNDAIRNIIRTEKTEQIYNAMQGDSQEGHMMRLEKCLADLVLSQKITKAVANSYASNQELLNAFLQSYGSN